MSINPISRTQSTASLTQATPTTPTGSRTSQQPVQTQQPATRPTTQQPRETNQTQRYRTAELNPTQVNFGARPGADAGAAIDSLRADFVSNNKVGLSRMGALDTRVDQMLSDPQMRAALIERYHLGSDANRQALMATGTMESGGNGDMGETMTATMNRAIVQNMMSEMVGSDRRVSIRDIVNQPNQYESASRVNAVLDGGRTHENWAAYREQAGGIADQIIGGQSQFTQNASDIFYFRAASFGRSTEFKIGKHNFDDALNGQHYVQDSLQMARGINHNR